MTYYFSLILLLVLSLNTVSNNASAKESGAENDTSPEILASERKPADQSKAMIDEVMKTKNLDDKEKEMRWIKKDKEKKKQKDLEINWLKLLLDPVAKLFATLFETGLWILLLIGLSLLFYYRKHWLHLFQASKQAEEEYQAPEIMFGMDVRPDSLPDDIVAEAQSLWQDKKHRESLSLLYRGALVHLINQEKVQLENSHTEGDVLKQSAQKISKGKQDYLQQLTQQWQAIAYAHRKPNEAMQGTMSNLFERWDSNFLNISNSNDGAAHE